MVNIRFIVLLTVVTIVSTLHAFAQDREIGCVGPLPDDIRSMVTFSDRPIQREVIRGTQGNPPPEAGTIIRVYSQPLELTGDFDGDGQMETVRAFTESSGPGGANPCPDGDNVNGCISGERVIQEPFTNSTNEWSMPAVFDTFQGVVARSEDRLGNFVPRTYEIRFTAEDAGSYAYHLFTSNRVVRYPIEIWDIGEVSPGETNDPADDVQMVIAVFSDGSTATGGDECTFGYDEIDQGDGTWLSDRLYAYYFRDGFDYEMYHNAVEQFLDDFPYELFTPLVGSLIECEQWTGLYICL